MEIMSEGVSKSDVRTWTPKKNIVEDKEAEGDEQNLIRFQYIDVDLSDIEY